MNNMNIGKEKAEAKGGGGTHQNNDNNETKDILTSHMSNMQLLPQSALKYPS